MVNIPAEYPQKVRQKDFAALLDISPAMVNKHKVAGRLVMDGKLVVVADSLSLIEASRDPARGGDRTGKPAPLEMAGRDGHSSPKQATTNTYPPAASNGDPDKMVYNVEAARHKRAEAQRSELLLAREAGELIIKRDRDSAEFTRARAGREAVMSIADRVASRVAAESDPHACYRIIESECRRVCDMLATAADDGAQLGQAA